MARSPRRPSEPVESSDVAVGIAATFARAVATVTVRPGRALAGAVLARPALRGGVDALASAGRDAEAGSRRRLEAAATRVLSAPESARTIDRALAGPVPEALSEETIERLGRRMIESPAFERVLREALASRMAQELTDEALKSPELQKALEDVLSGPIVRNVLARQTRTFGDEVAERIRAATARLDRRLVLGKRALAATRYGGLASRGVAAIADLALVQLVVLAVGAGVAFLVWLFGGDPSTSVLAPTVGSGWLLLLGAYFVFFWSTTGQTPGMRILGLRVTAQDGRPLRARRSLVRFVTAVLTIAPLGLGLIPVLFDERRRAVHDLVARTVVVYEASSAPSTS
jgi:uncharacterized RDD family membrane protein YckC